MRRIYRRVDEWEEIRFNMWGQSKNVEYDLRRAILFTGNHRLYGKYMMRVANEWPVSCQNALTDRSLNKRAWIGHAAVALALRIPENIVRKAWGYLSDEQQKKANHVADVAIAHWEATHKSETLPEDMGRQMLLEWDTGHDGTVIAR